MTATALWADQIESGDRGKGNTTSGLGTSMSESINKSHLKGNEMSEQDSKIHGSGQTPQGRSQEISAKEARQAEIVLDTPEKRWGVALIVGVTLTLAVVAIILAV